MCLCFLRVFPFSHVLFSICEVDLKKKNINISFHSSFIISLYQALRSYFVLETLTHYHTLCVFKVCGLKWSPDSQYLASGGNDNKLFVWNLHSLTAVQTYTEHNAAVKGKSSQLCFLLNFFGTL